MNYNRNALYRVGSQFRTTGDEGVTGSGVTDTNNGCGNGNGNGILASQVRQTRMYKRGFMLMSLILLFIILGRTGAFKSVNMG